MFSFTTIKYNKNPKLKYFWDLAGFMIVGLCFLVESLEWDSTPLFPLHNFLSRLIRFRRSYVPSWWLIHVLCFCICPPILAFWFVTMWFNRKSISCVYDKTSPRTRKTVAELRPDHTLGCISYYCIGKNYARGQSARLPIGGCLRS